MQNISHYTSIIRSKLSSLNKKFTAASRGVVEPTKRIELQRYTQVLEDMLRKLEANTLTWDDLQRIGITKKAIYDQSILEHEESTPEVTIEDFQLITNIPKLQFLSEDHYLQEKINKLFSIVEFINTSYQPIFIQKILLSASKTNSLRELFYMQHQEVIHIFNSYKSYVIISSTSDDHIKMMDKEYIQLIKAIYGFFLSILNYIELILKDTTFSSEDFAQPINRISKDAHIYNLTLREALNKCYEFVSESIEYIKYDNRDIFDYLSMDSSFQQKNH